MRIALVTDGPRSGPGTRAQTFATLRADQFALALAAHHLLHIDARLSDAELLRAGIDVAHPSRIPVDAVVSAGVYAPTRLALRIVGDRPLWLDLPGDPFADAQAAAWHGDLGDAPDRPGRVAAVTHDTAALFPPALARADAVSAVSGPSRHALLGALGCLGRVTRTPPGVELVHTVPVAWRFGDLPEGPARLPRSGGPLRVLLAGSLNTWFDLETAWAAVETAMGQADIELAVTGGAVPGHHIGDAQRLDALVRSSPHAARVRVHGWLPPDELERVIRASDVLLCLDREGYEPELGSRTRVLFALHQGLHVVATPTCELVRDLAHEGFVHPVPRGDAPATARVLLGLPHAAPLPDRAPLRARYAAAATTEPLRAWAAAPTRTSRSPVSRLSRWPRREGM